MSKKGWIILIIIICVIWYMNSDYVGQKPRSNKPVAESRERESSTNSGPGVKLPTPVFTPPSISCSSCNGSGRCKYCAGTGVDDFQTRMQERRIRCMMCSGSGGCTSCKGDGLINN